MMKAEDLKAMAREVISARQAKEAEKDILYADKIIERKAKREAQKGRRLCKVTVPRSRSACGVAEALRSMGFTVLKSCDRDKARFYLEITW